MPITRTPMIDDDGSGTTGTILNNAWKQELYNQIDAYGPVYASFTPTDVSGGGLVFQAGTQGKFCTLNRLVYLWLQVVYPATANSAFAKIGGFPHFVRTPVGVSQGYGPLKAWWLQEGSQVIEAHDLTTFSSLTNAQLSGANIILSAVYLTD